MKRTLRSGNRGFKVVAYILCIFLAILSLMPFVIMVVNSTRSTTQIQQHAIQQGRARRLQQPVQLLYQRIFQKKRASKRKQ